MKGRFIDIMFRVVICLTNPIQREYIFSLVEACFSSKEIKASILLFNSSMQMFLQDSEALRPDIFIFNPLDEKGHMTSTALSIKYHFPHVTSLSIGDLDLISVLDLKRLNPIYPVDPYDKKSFYQNIISTYELNLSDLNSFRYYNRPTYKSYPIDKIKYFISEGRRTYIVSDSLSDSEIYFYRKLDTIQELLTKKQCNFVRIHKSYLVNAAYISSYDKHSITLKNGECLSISNYSHYKSVKEHVG